MFRPPRLFKPHPALAVIVTIHGPCLLTSCALRAQNIPELSPDFAPLALRALMPRGAETFLAPIEGLKGAFAYGIGVQSSYNSNFFLESDNPQGELATSVLPFFTYYTDSAGGAPFSVTANYQPTYQNYLNNPDLSTFDNSGGVTLQAAGAKTKLSAFANYNTVSGTDRFSGTFVTGTLLGTGIRASYQVAPRTSLYTTWTLAHTDYGSSDLVGADTYTAEFGGLWSATELFSFGPSLGRTQDESSNTGSREAWSLSMQAQYQMDSKIQFFGSLGLQYATNSRDPGNNTLDLTGNLTANYTFNENLKWANTFSYVTVPSATDVNYAINNMSLSSTLTRQLLTASVSIGLDLNISDYVPVGSVDTQLGKENNLSAFLSYSRRVFLDRVDFNASIRYSLNDGESDWSQFLLSAGLRCQF